MVNIFTKGSCLNLYLILHSVYPESIAYFNIDHVITRIDDRYYDITGEVSSKGYSPLTSFYSKSGTSRAYKQMLRAEFELHEASDAN